MAPYKEQDPIYYTIYLNITYHSYSIHLPCISNLLSKNYSNMSRSYYAKFNLLEMSTKDPSKYCVSTHSNAVLTPLQDDSINYSCPSIYYATHPIYKSSILRPKTHPMSITDPSIAIIHYQKSESSNFHPHIRSFSINIIISSPLLLEPFV
jgi:hypothetical protein